MKGYTKEEYLARFPEGLATKRFYFHHHWPPSGDYCSCTRYFEGQTFEGQTKAYIDCPNCLGFGIMPIPWSELR